MGSQKDAGSTSGVSVGARVGFGLSLTVGTLGVCALSLSPFAFLFIFLSCLSFQGPVSVLSVWSPRQEKQET